MKNVLIRMRQFAETSRVTVTEKNIIDYILTNPEKVIPLSIHELAHESYSSSATIVRLCRKIGLKGYKDFRLAISYEIALHRKSTQQLKHDITQPDELEDIVRRVTSTTMTSLEHSVSLIELDILEKVVTLICSSNVILFYGMGSSLHVAKDAYLKLLRLNKPCYVNEDWHAQLVQARNTTPQNLGIVISYSGETREMIECVQAMHDNHTPIVSITRYGNSTIAKLSDYRLYVAGNESLFRNGAMSSRIVQLNLIDILYTAYASRHHEQTLKQLSKTHIEKLHRSKADSSLSSLASS